MTTDPEQLQEQTPIVTEKSRLSLGNVLLGVLVGIALSVGTFAATVSSIGGPEEKETKNIASTGTYSLAHSSAYILVFVITHLLSWYI